MSTPMFDRPSWLFSDLDGTLADTLAVAHRVYERFAEDAGFTPTAEEFAELNGPSLSEVVDLLARRYRLPGEHEALLGKYHRLWSEGVVHVEAKPGAQELFEEAEERSIEIAIVTSGSASFAELFLARNGWRDRVKLVISGDDVTRSKPDPAIYRLALQCAQCMPSSALAVEDSPNGVAAAVAAGIPVVALADGALHSASPESLVARGAGAVVPGLADVFARVAR
ncbi:MAG: HAD-IA family hydrolase [Labilithrix sp.]|nr:HAD-IA family hydrolase [Labilithrix sp.]